MPDDLRWVAGANDVNTFYELDAIRCIMYNQFGGGFITIDGILLTDIPPERDRFGGSENRYAVAVSKAYKRAHPETKLQLTCTKRTHVLSILQKLNKESHLP